MSEKSHLKDFVLTQGPLSELLQTVAGFPVGETLLEEWSAELLVKTRAVIESAPEPIPQQMESLHLSDEELLIFGVLLGVALSPSRQNIFQTPTVPPGVPLSNLFQILPAPTVLRCLRSGAKLRQSSLTCASAAFVLDADVEIRLPELFVVRFFMPSADRFLRVQVWEHVIPPEVEISEGLDLDLLAARYELSPAGIRNAMALTTVKSIIKGSQKIEAKTLEDSARNQLAVGPSRFVYVRKPKGTLDRLVVPPDVMKKLRFLVAAARNRVEVMTKWGFDEIFTSGKGITALFTGEAGTGKTFCPELVAGELGVDLWHVDLSAIVSKYVGETEKNIHDLFSRLTRAHPLVLLLGEADALFGQRVEVKTATDKFANLEINVLLQEMDRFEGVLILTSNLPENIDQAFRRRLLVHIQFPAPDTAQREELWRKLLPPNVPLAPDVDFAYLARCFELTGGFIRNAILCAAYAARERGVVTMNDLMSAALEQAQAAGKLARIT